MTIALRKLAAEPAAVVPVLVEAFVDDAAVRMLYPDDRDYRRHFPQFVLAFGGGAFEAGTADRSPGGDGAALWYPPGVEPDGEAIMACLEASVPADRLDRMRAGMELQASLHPHAPHW